MLTIVANRKTLILRRGNINWPPHGLEGVTAEMSWKEVDPITTRMCWDMKLQLRESISVEEITRRNIPRISRDSPMKEAVEVMDEMGLPYLLVEDEGSIIGFLTREAEMALRWRGQQANVGQFVSPSTAISGKATLMEVARIMGRRNTRHILVKDEENVVVGLASLDDILVVAPELIREFCTLRDLVGLALESRVDISVHLRKKINDLSRELARTGGDAEGALRELRVLFEKRISPTVR